VSDFEKKRALVSGGEIAYIEEGDPENPAVVLLHGFPTSSFLWRELIPLLVPWFRAVAPDLLGCGDSDKLGDAPLHIRAQAAYVRELLGRLGIGHFAVVGHGDGGGIAQLLALEGGVEAMVLLDSIAFDAWPGPATREMQAAPPEEEPEELVREALAAFLREAIRAPGRLTDLVAAEYGRPFVGEDGVRAFFRGIQGADGLGLTGKEAELARLDCPVLIVWGEEDPFLPVGVAERLSDALPMSTLALLPGCSHLVIEDAPETVVPLLFEYLRSRYLHEGHTHAEPGPVVVPLGRRPPEDAG